MKKLAVAFFAGSLFHATVGTLIAANYSAWLYH